MDRRVRERRRSVTKERGRRRAGLVLVLAVALTLAALFLWLRSSDVFAVERITSTAVRHLSLADISRATADARGVSLLRLSTGAIEERLSALPYVSSVQVKRRFPNTLDIRLVEHEPVARFRGEEGDVWLVAVDGRVLEKGSVAGLPLVTAPEQATPPVGQRVPTTIVEALSLVALLREEGTASSLPPVKWIEVSPNGEVVVMLEDEAELRLGYPTKLKQKLTAAAAIIEQCLRDGKELRYLDVSTPDRVAVNQK